MTGSGAGRGGGSGGPGGTRREERRGTIRVGHGPRGMSMPVEKPKDFKGTLRRLLVYLRPHRGRLILVLFMAALSTVFAIISPKVLGQATTVLFDGFIGRFQGDAAAGVDFDAIGRILLLLAALYVISAAFTFLQQFLMAGVSQNTVFALRQDVNAKLARLPLKFFDGRPHGETLSRVTNDIDNISNTMQQSLTQLITSAVTLLGTIVMMLTISPVLTLVTVITLPLSIFVTGFVARRSQAFFKTQQEALGNLNGHVEEMYAGHEVVKAFGHEGKSVETFTGMNDRLYEAGWKAQFISGIIMPLMGLINNLGYVFISVAGGILVTRRAITVGDIQAFIQYSRQFGQPIMQLASIANILQSTIASAERVFELLDEVEKEPDREEPARLPSPRGEITFRNVDFSYDPEVDLIENMNFTARPGQVVAIVGPTGAGKTTLVNLLMRFYEIDGGSITIDGVDIKDMARSRLRRLFGMVLQDTWLYKGTIRENIAYGREGAADADVEEAARTAHAHHFINTLPDGYDTMLDEEASNLSQGQKQLITIARAVLADPAILILDEATSSVDTRTELHIRKAMDRIMEGRTSFVIAHRLSTIRNADVILVMDEGRIVEQGRHEDLLEQGGFYADLFASQFNSAPASGGAAASGDGTGGATASGDGTGGAEAAEVETAR